MSGPVTTVREDMPVEDAGAALVANGFAALPVVDGDGRVVGIVDEADLMRGRVVPDGWQVDALPARHVRDVMTVSVLCGHPDDDAADTVAAMLDRRIRSVPVVKDGRPVGIVSRRDLLRAIARLSKDDRFADASFLASHDRGTP
jgi:CBS domain-containing protein